MEMNLTPWEWAREDFIIMPHRNSFLVGLMILRCRLLLHPEYIRYRLLKCREKAQNWFVLSRSCENVIHYSLNTENLSALIAHLQIQYILQILMVFSLIGGTLKRI